MWQIYMYNKRIRLIHMYSQNTTFRMAIESLHLLMSRKHPENCYIIHTYIQYICIFIYSNKTNICVYTTNSIFRAATEWLHVPMSHKYSENCYIIHTYIREYLYIYTRNRHVYTCDKDTACRTATEWLQT